MGDGADQLDAKVIKWIESSGRALELRVARAFQISTCHPRVLTSFIYADPIESKPREGDVGVDYSFTTRSGEEWRVQVTVECKSSTSKPWILFQEVGRTAGQVSLTDWVAGEEHLLTNRVKNGMPYGYGWIGQHPFDGHPASHIASATLGDTKLDSKANGENVASAAVKQAMSAATARASSSVAATPTGSTLARYVGLAVVVTCAPLFQCALSPEGAICVNAVIDGDVWDPAGRGRRVFVVTEDHLRNWIQALEQRIETAIDEW